MPQPDGHYDAAALDAALKALIATNLFDNVAIDHAGERLVVHLTEAKVLDRVAFEGNKKIKDEQLKAVVESKARGPLQRALVQADVGRIMEAYRHAGRDDVGVVPEIIDRGNDRVDLVYEVTEGAKTTVRQINFVGNQAFSNRQLGAVIKTSPTTMLSFLTGGDVYDPDRVAADREQLRLYYRSKGYADASVPTANAEYDPAAKGFTLTFSIDEGPLYHFGDINLVCNVAGTRSRKAAPPAADQDRRRVRRQRARQDHRDHRHRTGKARLSLRPGDAPHHPRCRRAAHRHRLVIDQGPRTYVERIDIHGNTRTRGYVIRREFDIAEGDAYNKTLIDRAERRLKNLNYFKTVKISTKPGSASDRVVLDVEVAEQSTGDFNIAGGYSTTDGLLAEVKVGENNFLGTGAGRQGLRELRPIRARRRPVGVGAVFPRHPVAAGVDLFAKQTDSSSYQSYGSDSLWRDLVAGHCRSTSSSACNGATRSRGRTSRSIRRRSPRRPRCRSSRPRLRGRNGSPRSATPSPTTRSTTTRCRPAASARSSSRISPASAAT